MHISQRLKIALAVARRRGADLTRLYPGVLSVGAGFRLQEGESVADEVCLRFLVKRKRIRRGRNDIPQEIRAIVFRRGQRMGIRIPTDVSEHKPGRPHTNLTEGIVTQAGGQLIEYGSACCIVKDAASPGHKYLLTCYHVLSPSMQFAPNPTLCLDCATNSQIATYNAILTPTSPGDPLDAALLAIEPGVAPINVWGHLVTGKASDADLANLNTTTPLWLLVRRQVPSSAGVAVPPRPNAIQASFHTVWPSRTYIYPDPVNASYTFMDTMEYSANVYAGDSGSALIDNNGTLFGMHFFGDDESGYAFSAPRLFDSGVFGISIWLN